MKQIVNKWLKIVQQLGRDCLALPCHCVLCLQPSKREFALCEACEIFLPWLDHPCALCGDASPVHDLCSKCQHTLPPYERLQSLFNYAWPVNGFISQLKYAGHLHFAKMLGKLMLNRLSVIYPIDCVIAMPLHPNRQRSRGFNQSLELASIIVKELQLRLDRWHCTKILDTPAQSLLSASKRAKNLSQKSFHIAPRFNAKHVLVIEDVVTTGTTVNALTRALKGHGVSTVEIWSICRTQA